MKRFISNEDLVRKFFVQALEEKEVLRYLLVISSLVKSYGHKLDISEGYLQAIAKKNPEIAKLYGFLHTLGKTNSKDLNDIIKICKKIYAQYRKEFTISSGKSSQKVLDTFLHKTFDNADVDFVEAPVLGVDLRGEGYRYHRNLDKDLDTILWS